VVHNRYRSSLPSGEDHVVEQETTALQSLGMSVDRFERCSDHIATMPAAQKAMVPVRLAWNRQAQGALARAIATSRPDVVHVHNVYPLIGPSVLRACGEVPVIVTFHNYRPMCPTGELFRDGRPCSDCAGKSLPLDALRHRCYRQSALATASMIAGSVVQRRLWQTVPSAYIFLSQVQQELLGPLGLPPERCFVKHNMVPANVASDAREHLVAFIGRLDERKGILLLLDAWDAMSQRLSESPMRLAIAGTGPLEEQVRTWAQHRPEVSVLGMLGRDQCAALAARASAVVVPSTYAEPFGLVVGEAMAAGTPPIAPRFGAFPELIEDGVDGLLFAPGDPAALGAAIRRVLDDPKWSQAMGRRALGTYWARFSPETNAQELAAIYRFALEHPRRSDTDLVVSGKGAA